MSEKHLEEISRKLSVIIALSLRQLTGDVELVAKKKGKQGVGDTARYLADLGLDPKTISEILGAPLASIRTLLTPKRRK